VCSSDLLVNFCTTPSEQVSGGLRGHTVDFDRLLLIARAMSMKNTLYIKHDLYIYADVYV